MTTIKQLAKNIKKWYDEVHPDFLTDEGVNQLYAHLNAIDEYEEMCDEYIDPLEYRGSCGHHADEDFYLKDDEEE